MAVLTSRQVRPGQVYRDRDRRRPATLVVERVAGDVAWCTRYRHGGPVHDTVVRLDRLNDPTRFEYARTQASERDRASLTSGTA